MKRYLIIALFLLCGCGTIELTPNGHRLFYKSPDGQISCYTNRCCLPYREKVMLCTEPTLNNVLITVNITPDK